MKIVVADDEHLVRYSIKSMLNDMALGFDLDAEAANGEELLRLVTECDPDICLVDIRMPGMNGLDTIRRARQLGNKVRWIVLSSYAEFDYASEAMRLGASAYLLKPASPQELRQAILPLVEAIRHEDRDDREHFERALELALSRDTASPAAGARPDGTRSGGARRIWACKIDLEPCAGSKPGRLDGLIQDLIWRIRELPVAAGNHRAGIAVSVFREASLVAAVHFSGSESAMPESVRTARALLSDLIAGYRDMTDLGGLDGAFDSAEDESRAGRPGFILNTVWFNECDSLEALTAQIRELKSFESTRILTAAGTQQDFDTLKRRSAFADPGLAELSAALVAFCGAYARTDRETMRTLVGTVEGLESGMTAFPQSVAEYLALRTGQRITGSESLASALRRLCEDDTGLTGPNDHVVDAVEKHIRTHYASGVFVPNIASALGLSPNYLSAVFHRAAGLTISEKLAEVRLEHARAMLANPGVRVKEASFAVGYKDVRHFTKLFKEKYGRLPSEIAHSGSVSPRLP